MIQSCVPVVSASILSLQINNSNKGWITLKKIPSNKLSSLGCKNGFRKLVYSWKVDVSKGGSLRLWDKGANGSYLLWPDGIEIIEK